MKTRFVVPVLLALSLSVARVLPAHACASMSEMENAVRVVDESAVIVWDEKTKTQHFIRSATFDGSGKSVGFIVPTPTVPKLAEADNDVFWRLEELTKPKVVVKEYSAYGLESFLLGQRIKNTFNAAGSKMTDDDDGDVEVVSSQSVGDFDATVLRATSARALNRWLRKNGYKSNAAFEKWLDVYVQKRWVVTAFKIRTGDTEDHTFTSQLVRMSFQTPRPFFPYREPQQSVSQASKKGKTKKRSLRIFFFAPTRMQAEQGNFNASKTWPGKIKWADDVKSHFNDENTLNEIATNCSLPSNALKAAPRLTVFEDTSTPRPGTDDVFFAPSPNRSTLPPPIVVRKKVTKPIYIEVILLAFGVLLLGGGLLMNRRRK